MTKLNKNKMGFRKETGTNTLHNAVLMWYQKYWASPGDFVGIAAVSEVTAHVLLSCFWDGKGTEDRGICRSHSRK